MVKLDRQLIINSLIQMGKSEKETRGGVGLFDARAPTLRIWFWEIFSGYQVHDCSFAQWESKGAQRYVAVKKPALVDKPQDLSL